MTFKEFKSWCYDRACDGCLGMTAAIVCIHICDEIMKEHWWKRNKVWHEKYEKDVVEQIVDPINKKIKELYG